MTTLGQPRVRRGFTYRERFLAHNGPGPWKCFECGGDVDEYTLLVHHVDLNHDNDEPENLVAAHSGCHAGYHKRIRGDKHTDEFKKRMSEMMKGRIISAESIAQGVATRRARGAYGQTRGRPLTQEHKFKISQARLAQEAQKRRQS